MSGPAEGKAVFAAAAGGAAWTIATGVGSRGLGLAGTLLITYFVARDELGEVSDAAIAVLLANQLSTVGAGQYYISHPAAGRDVAWHATLVHCTLGVVALVCVLALEHPLSVWMRAPSLARFLPGLLISGLFERLAYMPERVLVRAMRFRTVGLCRAVAELAYSFTSVLLAVCGWGGMSVVLGNVARSLVRFVGMARSIPLADWVRPSPLSIETVTAMLRFGLPMSVGMGAGYASRRVDNAIVSGLFGAHAVSAYNLAYNVADVPAVQVGEQIGDVLLPSFALLRAAERREALVRSTALLALVTFPLAVGLGAVAPTLVRAVLPAEWQDVGPMIVLLSAMSVVRPIGWTIASYLLALDRPGLDATLEVAKLCSLVGLLLSIGRLGVLWSCVAVGLAFSFHSLASMIALQVVDGLPVARLAMPCLRPLVACVPMAAVVIATKTAFAWTAINSQGLALVAEVLLGAGAYFAVAPLIARSASLELLELVRRGRERRTVGGALEG